MSNYIAPVFWVTVVVGVFLSNQVNGQRITTIQLEGTQYFISRMNPYAPELNYYLAYQYCRSIGLQLVSFETLEKSNAMTQYLKNAGYVQQDFWTSGNKLGTEMFIWMSTGLPFNTTFNNMRQTGGGLRTERVFPTSASGRSAGGNINPGVSCVALTKPTMEWDTYDCLANKDFICEQTRCYYYNYGAIPVTASQGGPTTKKPYLNESDSITTIRPDDSPYSKLTTLFPNFSTTTEANIEPANTEPQEQNYEEQHPVYVETDAPKEYRTEGPYDTDYSGEVQNDDSAQDIFKRSVKEEEYYSTIVPDNSYNYK